MEIKTSIKILLVSFGIVLVGIIAYLYFVNPLQKYDRTGNPLFFLLNVGLMILLLIFPKRKVLIALLLYLVAVSFIVRYFFLL